jgi:hypothetical protein
VGPIQARTGWVQQVLLSCGILAPLLYVGVDRLAGRLVRGYDFVSQSMGELSAVGAPTRLLVVSVNALGVALMIAFGTGVWRMTGPGLLSRISASLVVGQAVAGLVMVLFFAPRYGERPIAASTGVIVGALGVVMLVLAIGFGAAAFGGWFRVLSIAILAAYVLLAVLRFTLLPTDQSVSLVGVQERTMLYAFLLWVLAFAVYCLVSGRGASPTGSLGA